MKSSINQDQFTDTSQGVSTIWEPKQTGNKKDGNLKALEANDKSWIAGYYLGETTGLGKQKNANLINLKVDACGDTNLIQTSEEIKEGMEVSIWGTGVLNDKIRKNVSPGQYILVTWKGKQQPKGNGDPYHGWDVAINESIEPINVTGTSTAPANDPAPANASVAQPAADEDDLPF